MQTPDLWKSIVQLVEEIKKCDDAGFTSASLVMSYVCIDAMAFLSMPAGQTSQTRKDFIAWADQYLKGHPDQPYQYRGIDVYAARCATVHTYGIEAELHRKDPTIMRFGYHDGGTHAFNPQIDPNLVIIGTKSFTNDVVSAVSDFLERCQQDAAMRSLVESRLPTVLQAMPLHD